MASLLEYQKNGEIVEPPLYKYMKGNVKGFLNSIPDPSKMTKEEQLNMALNANPMMGLLGIKEVLPQLAQFQQQRLIQAADLVPNLEKQYTDKALLQAFQGSRVSNKGNLFSVIKPEEFTQNYALQLPSTPSGFSPMYIHSSQYDNAIMPPTTAIYQKHLANVLKKVGGFSDVPYLELGLKKGVTELGGSDALKITGHEGRNRTTALANRGDANTLVEILPAYSMTNSEKYSVPEWTYGNEANQHYLDTIKKYFGSLNPKVINQQGDSKFNLPIF